MSEIFTLLDWVGALLIAGALAMTALTHKEIPAVRNLLLIGAGLTVLRWLMWAFSTDTSWPLRSLAGALIGALLLGALPALWQWAREKERAIPNDSASVTLDNKISFNCYHGPRPTHGREDRPLYMLQIIEPPPVGPEYPGYTSAPPGLGEMKWGEGMPEWVIRCTLTNYADIPFFGVSVPLKTIWREVEKIENGTRAGNIIASRAINSPPLDIGTGSRNEEYFYIINNSIYYISIEVPDTASVRQAGSDQAKNTKLIPPSMWMPMSLQPNSHRKPAPTNPPAGAPPSQAPPEQPEKK